MINFGRISKLGYATDETCYFVGTTAAIIGGLLAAGGSVAGAAIAHDASSNAAATEAKANNDALAFAQQKYNAGVQALAPYQFGGPAMAGLGGPVNDHAGAGSLLTGYANSVPGASARSIALGTPQGTTRVPPMGLPAGVANNPNLLYSTNPSPFTPAPQAPAGMVTVRAPNGQIAHIPLSQRQKAQDMGATVIG